MIETQASDPVADLTHSLTWALGVIKSAPSAADICPWHGRTPFPHVCSYYNNVEWTKALALVSAPMVNSIWLWSTLKTTPPANGQFRSQSGNWQGAITLNIAKLDNGAVDQSLGLAKPQMGDKIRIELASDPNTWTEYVLTAAPSSTGSYYIYSVSKTAGAGSTPLDGVQVRLRAISSVVTTFVAEEVVPA